VYKLIRNILFLFEPELAHAITLNVLKFIPKFFFRKVPDKPCKVMGIDFPNPVGLAAGMDKDGDYIDALAKLGFGFIEIGGITPRPQPGNPKPRLFRIPERQALINRFGFNNKGVDYTVARLQHMKYKGVIGINIAKNRDTPLENAVDDYLICIRKLYPYVHFIAVNISSPNTPGLRQLQYGDYLKQLLPVLKQEQQKLAAEQNRHVALLIKIAPDLEKDDIQQLAETLLEVGIDGVIATNTTLSRENVEGEKHGDEQGGLSGEPLTQRSTEVIQQLHEFLKDEIPIIASGGVMSAEDAKAKIEAGAKLVQVFTGLVYRGPGLVSEIKASVPFGKPI